MTENMAPYKYLEILCLDGWGNDSGFDDGIYDSGHQTDTYLFPIDETVTPELLNRLCEFFNEMDDYEIEMETSTEVKLWDKSAVDKLFDDDYVGFTTRSLMDKILTAKVLEKFLRRYEGDELTVNTLWNRASHVWFDM